MSIPGVTGIDTSRTGGPVRPLAEPRGLPTAFGQRSILDTADPIEATAALRQVLGVNHIRRVHDGARIRLHGVQLPSLSLTYLAVDGGLTVDVLQTPSHQLLLTPTVGTAELRTGGQTVQCTPLRACCARPAQPLRVIHHGDGPMMIMTIEQDALHRGVDALMGRSFDHAVDLDPVMDLTTQGAERWQTALHVLHSELARTPDRMVYDVDLLPLEAFIVTTLLMVQQSSCYGALHQAPEVRHNRVVRRAIQHVEEHLVDPFTVADLAAVAGVSIRTLQAHFRASFGQTPTQYIRDQRLDRAHEDLQTSAHSVNVSVTDIALRWGFRHEGRFAAQYRRRFGEAPSTTMRR